MEKEHNLTNFPSYKDRLPLPSFLDLNMMKRGRVELELPPYPIVF